MKTLKLYDAFVTTKPPVKKQEIVKDPLIHSLNQSDVYNVLNKKVFGKYVIQVEQEGAMSRYNISLADQEYSQNGPPMEQYKVFNEQV